MGNETLEFAPTRAEKYVESLWVTAPDAAATKRVLPDGCSDIIFSLTVDGLRIDFVGPMTSAAYIPLVPGEISVGVRFTSGTVLPALSAPLRSIRDRGFGITGNAARALRLAPPPNIASADDLLDYADQWSASLARSGGFSRDGLVDRVLQAIDGNPAASMYDLYHVLGVNARAVERRFLKMVGMSPKFYARTQRHRRAAGWLAGTQLPPFADLALELGFADQAHFIHDFAAFAGITPLKFREEQNIAR